MVCAVLAEQFVNSFELTNDVSTHKIRAGSDLTAQCTHTDTGHVQHICLGLAQARPNYSIHVLKGATVHFFADTNPFLP